MGLQDLSGVTLGQYQLTRLLGTGGMAAVYLAHQASLRRQVAVKVLPPTFASQPHAAERFQREAETAAALNHPHIVHIYEFGTDQGISYLVMQLLTGGALSRALLQGTYPSNPGQAMGVIRQVASALNYAHGRGAIHRDIKPANILFDEDGNCVVVDFGIAKLLQETTPLTSAGVIIGTPAYMAPEQCRNETITAAVDQYALGVIAFEMITGRLPFKADDPWALMYQHVHEEPPVAHALTRTVPESVSYVLARALAKDPDARFPKVIDFAQALEQAFRNRVLDVVVPPPPEDPLPPQPVEPVELPDPQQAPDLPRPRRRACAAATLLVLVFATVLVAFGIRMLSLLQSNGTSGQATQDPVIVALNTLDAQATATQKTLSAQTAVAMRQTQDWLSTQRSSDQTATATLWTLTPTPNMTASIDAFQTQRAATTQAWIDSWTNTPAPTATATATPTRTPNPDPLAFARTPVTRNADWTPVPRDFNGVEMVLVPAGCFMMGSNDGDSDERPVHEVCFEEPFWIDKYEVTNGRYGSEGYFSGDDRPRESISWYDAQDFCERRGARLPTEAEWEYAARGPDGLVYPWGNTSVADNVVYSANSGGQTAAVGSRTGGVSWVGALDLSGNVWEWVTDWYGTYPSERQVNPQGPASGDYRVLRGGSWGITNANFLRAAYRDGWNPGSGYDDFGFRCARSALG